MQNENWQSGLHFISASCSSGAFDLVLDILKLNLLSGSTTIPVSTSVKCEQHPISLSVKEIIFQNNLKAI